MSQVICLGEILIDYFTSQPGQLRSEVTDWTPLPGGAIANVACGLAKLGQQVEFVGALGQDHWGDALIKLLTDMGVGHRGIQRRHKASTRQVYVTTDEQGDRTFAGFSESDPTLFADAHLFASALKPELFKGADVLVLGTSSLAYLDTREAVEQAVSLAQQNHTTVLVDINWQPMFWPKPAEAPGHIYDLIKQTQVLKVSKAEADWLFGSTSPAAIAHQMPQLEGVIVTTSTQGCQYCFHGTAGQVLAFDVDIEETTGANDAFTAGFIHQLLQKGPHSLSDPELAHEIVVYASAMSALTMTRPGAIAALPTLSEIDVFLYLTKSPEK